MEGTKYILFTAMLCLLVASGVGFTADANWFSLGESNLGTWQVYIDAGRIKTDSEGYVHVYVLDDFRVTQEGIDLVDSTGEMYFDARYKHRSTITSLLLDCEEQLEVLLWTRYYAKGMGKGELILKNVIAEPMWTEVLFNIEKKLTNYACNKSK